jgi:hypothetical protein
MRGQVAELVGLYLKGVERDRLDPLLDACVAVYNLELDEDGQGSGIETRNPSSWPAAGPSGYPSTSADASSKILRVMAQHEPLMDRRMSFCRRRPAIGRRPPAVSYAATGTSLSTLANWLAVVTSARGRTSRTRTSFLWRSGTSGDAAQHMDWCPLMVPL